MPCSSASLARRIWLAALAIALSVSLSGPAAAQGQDAEHTQSKGRSGVADAQICTPAATGERCTYTHLVVAQDLNSSASGCLLITVTLYHADGSYQPLSYDFGCFSGDSALVAADANLDSLVLHPVQLTLRRSSCGGSWCPPTDARTITLAATFRGYGAFVHTQSHQRETKLNQCTVVANGSSRGRAADAAITLDAETFAATGSLEASTGGTTVRCPDRP